ncbi:MAG: sensor histidine kinase [Propionibacteriaceae bacterium]|nr:sensor histidine kinase [Propionibacteriaceae bacterium]
MDTRELPANWLRTDATITVALALLGGVMAWFTHLSGQSFFNTPAWLQATGSILLTVPLLWRRRFPLTSGLAASVIFVVLHYLTGMEMHTAQVALFVSFYSIGAWSTQRERALLVRILICAGMALWLGVAFALRIIEEVDGTVLAPIRPLLGIFALQVSLNVAFFTGAWVFGNRSFDQVVEREQLRQAHADIQHLESELVRQAIEQERLRIARELHDIVAHHVTTMSVQAAAARRVIGRDPEAATSSLKHIEASARHAVEELRTMVLTLRASDGSDVVPPTVDDLPELVASARTSGLDASYEVLGEMPEVSPAVGLTLYRVAQEGLTNATKHAGPGVRVEVRLRGHPEQVELEVSDDGYGEREGLPGTGTGIIGMRERVEAIGGVLTAGTKPRGGFRVRAEIPTGVTA